MEKTLTEMTLEELWELFPIILTEHKPSWAERYKEEEAALKRILPFARFYHVGSTAISGIMSKPIIDILIAVNSTEQMREAADIMQRNGYTVMSTSEKRISLNKGYTTGGYAQKVFHLHVRLENDLDEIYFRDYLIAHPAVAKEYEKLKTELCKKFERDRDAYTKGKTEFVKKYTALAVAEFGKNHIN